jgi:DNA-binding transcriptional LysR family regulator
VELRHVRYFVAVAESGTVSAAAVREHVTQPGLSRQLRQLEQELGVSLFDRRAGRLTLSRTGRELLPRARDLLAAADALRSDATFHAEGGVQHVTIAAPTVTLTDVVSPFVAAMSREDPVVDVRSGDGLTTAVMLEQGADLAIGIQRPRAPHASRDLAALPVWAYVRPDDPWARRERVPLAELSDRLVIGLPTSFTAREALDSAALATGTSFDQLLEAGNGTIAQALAAAGRGVAVVSDDARFGLVPLAVESGGDLLTVRLVAAWDLRGIAAPYLAELAARLGAWVAAHYEVREHG